MKNINNINLKEVFKLNWELGINERGLGHNDYAVVTTDEVLVVECLNKEVANYIIKCHNYYKDNNDDSCTRKNGKNS